MALYSISRYFLPLYGLLLSLSLQAQPSQLHQIWAKACPDWWQQYSGLVPRNKNLAVATRYGISALVDTRCDTLTPFLYKSINLLPGTPYLYAQRFDDTWALLDSLGRVVRIADENFEAQENKILSSAANHIRFIHDFAGRDLTPPVLQQHRCTQVIGRRYICSDDGILFGIADESGKWALTPQFTYITLYRNPGMMLGRKEGYEYLVDPKTGWISRPYTEIRAISQAFFWAKLQPDDAQFTCYNFKDEPAPGAPLCDEITLIAPEMGFIYKNGDLFGVLDARNNVVMAGLLNAERIYAFPKGEENKTNADTSLLFLKVQTETGWGILRKGKWVVEPQYQQVYWKAPYWIATTTESSTLFTANGALYRQCPYPELTLNDEGWLLTGPKPDTIWNLDGRFFKLPARTQAIRQVDMSSLFYAYTEQRQYALLSASGVLLAEGLETAPFVMNYDGFSQLFQLTKQGLSGWYNNKSQTTIEPQYEQVQMDRVGCILVRKGLYWSIVSPENKPYLPFEFTDMKPNGTIALVGLKQEQKWRLFDCHRKSLLPMAFDALEAANGRCFWGETDGKWNLYAYPDWKPVLPQSQADAKPERMYSRLGENVAKQGNKCGTLDFFGKTVLPFVWDSLYDNFAIRGDSVFELNRRGEVLQSFKAKWVTKLWKTGYAVYEGTHWTFHGNDGKPLNERTYRNYYPLYTRQTGNIRFAAGRTDGKLDFLSELMLPVKTIDADIVSVFTSKYLSVKRDTAQYLLRLPDFAQQPQHYDYVIEMGKNRYQTQRGKLRGLVDANLREILPPVFSAIQFTGKFIEVHKQDSSGLYRPDGTVAIPLDAYSPYVHRLGEDFYVAEKGGLAGYYSISQGTWTPPSLEDINSCNIRIPLTKALFWFRVNGLYGVMDADCKKVIPAEYQHVEREGNYISLMKSVNHWSVYSPYTQAFLAHDQRVVIGQREEVLFGNDTIWCVYDKGQKKYEGRHAELRWLIPNELLAFSNQIGQIGVMQTDGKVLCEPAYEQLNLLSVLPPVQIKVAVKNQYGVIDPQGKVIIPTAYSDVELFAGRTAILVVKNGKKGLFDPNGKLLLPVEYDDIRLDNDDNFIQFILQKAGKMTIADRNGILLTTRAWDEVRPFHLGIAAVKENGLWGYVDAQGKQLTPFRYSYAGNFFRYDNLSIAIVMIENDYYTIDANGKTIADYILSDAYMNYSNGMVNMEQMNAYREIPFYSSTNVSQGFYFVESVKSSKKGLVNLAGNWVLRPEYEDLRPAFYGREIAAMVRVDKLWGLVDRHGRIVIAPRYEEIESILQPPHNDRFRVKENGVIFIINGKGERM